MPLVIPIRAETARRQRMNGPNESVVTCSCNMERSCGPRMRSEQIQSRSQARVPFFALFALSVVAAGCMWFYVDHILKPRQVLDAATHNRPRGNLSDLYPRWLGARELLLRGR